MNLQECRRRIVETPVFAELPPGMRAGVGMLLLWLGEVREVADAKMIFVEGDDSSLEGCVLLDGVATVERAGKDSIRIEAPALLGEMSQLRPTTERTATVISDGTSWVLSFSWAHLVELASALFTREEQLTLRDTIRKLAESRGLANDE